MTEAQRLIEATCPDCRGPMNEVKNGDLAEYRCLVGHVYSPRSLLQAHSETQENALWAAVVALEESAKLVDAVSSSVPSELAERLQQQAAEKLRQAQQVRRILERLEPFQVE